MISIVVISKDEPALATTLTALRERAREVDESCEVVVVDASRGRLAEIRERHPDARWLDYEPPSGVGISIPHQRNAGVALAAGDLIVFTDAGCVPRAGWLERLTAPLRSGGEQVVAGISVASGGQGLYDTRISEGAQAAYLDECPTINMAFHRSAFDAVGGFDEHFEYGSDIDFSWRLVDAGFRIRSVSDAVVEHDWGDHGRQLKRGYLYGRARARLYRKHLGRLRSSWRRDPMVLVYPAFLLGLPLTLLFPLYPALLLIPAWRNREDGPLRVLGDHLAFGVGVLSELAAR
jgi:GT2 family glycosyltransferase